MNWRTAMKRKVLACVAVCLASAATSAKDTESVTMNAVVAPSCEFSAGEPNVVTDDPLYLKVAVTRDCNTTHEVTVTYEPTAPTNPVTLYFGAATPNQTGPGSATFTNLAQTNSVLDLRLYYTGPEEERDQIQETIHVTVTMTP